jgi:hypothetical protein
MLKGYKTYLVVVIGILVNGAASMGYIEPNVVEIINKVLVFLGLGAIRSGVKSETKVSINN